VRIYENKIHNQIRAKQKIANSLHRKVTAIVLGVDVWHELKNEMGNEKGFLDWFIVFNPDKDPEMFGYRILVSNVIGEISLI